MSKVVEAIDRAIAYLSYEPRTELGRTAWMGGIAMMVIGTVEALYNGTNLILDATNSLHHAAGHAEGLIAGIAVSGGGVVVSGRGAEAVDEWVDNRHASGQ